MSDITLALLLCIIGAIIVGSLIDLAIDKFVEYRKKNRHNCYNCQYYQIDPNMIQSADIIFYSCKKNSKILDEHGYYGKYQYRYCKLYKEKDNI